MFGAVILSFLALAGAALALALVAHGLRLPARRGAKADLAWLTLRWLCAALFAASAVWIVVSPRADQPVLDLLERVFPAVRSAYVSDAALEMATRAQRRADGYRAQAEKAGVREAQARPYRELANHEEVVVREVRDRARETRRWWIALVFAVFALALVVSKIGPLRGFAESTRKETP